jgi:hypothetical protein
MHIERALTRRRGGQQMYRKKYRGLCFCMTVAGSFSARRERMDPAIFYALGMNCILPMKPYRIGRELLSVSGGLI